MQLSFKNKYKSIQIFNSLELPIFTVLTGKNGSGKTHLLEAIDNQFVQLGGYTKNQITLFNYQDFLIGDQGQITKNAIDQLKMQAWGVFSTKKNQLIGISNQIKAEVGDVEKPFLQDNLSNQAEYDTLVNNLQSQISILSGNNYPIRSLLLSTIHESGKYIDQIIEDDFFEFGNFDLQEYSLMTNLSQIFINYAMELAIKKQDLSVDEYQILEKGAPWNFINTLFSEFGLNHKVTFPIYTIQQLARKGNQVNFQVMLNIDNTQITFQDLSSGERILCALAMTIYQNNNRVFPKVLLLDEIDAFLHPSQVVNLIKVIEEVFLQKNCAVILVTHSPTTIALVHENAVFEVQKGVVEEKIRKISKKDGVKILSDGYMSLEEGLDIFDEIFKKDITIISEGKNYEHIRKAFETLGIDDSKIHLYEHNSGSGDTTLLGLFEFFKKTNPSKKVLFVWDCDVQKKVDKKDEGNNIFKFCFSKNSSNKIAKKGIENIYPESLFTEGFFVEIKDGKAITKNFKENTKNKFFTDKILTSINKSDFSGYVPLIDKINEISGL